MYNFWKTYNHKSKIWWYNKQLKSIVLQLYYYTLKKLHWSYSVQRQCRFCKDTVYILMCSLKD